MSDSIADNLKAVQDVIAAACARVNRSPESVRLVAVSKRKPVSDVLAAADAGVVHFGENRVEEMQEKYAEVMAKVQTPIRWHMIGHVQSRKARHVPELFDVVESVDSVKIAERLSRHIGDTGRQPMEALVQINVSGEESKSGVFAANWQTDQSVRDALVTTMESIIAQEGLDVRGLMTMAPLVDDPEQTRPIFADLYSLREYLRGALGVELAELSMGMTNDYAVAIEEGATIVRIGRAIFGERVY